MQAHADVAHAAADAADARASVAAWAAAALAATTKPSSQARPTPTAVSPHRPPSLSSPPATAANPITAAAIAEADALRLKGNAAFTARDWEGAAGMYAASLALAPTAAAAANHSAAALRCGDARAALASAEAALALRPFWAKAHARRGAALSALGDDVEAFLAWDTAVQCEPDDAAWAAGRVAALEAAAAVRGWRLPGVGREVMEAPVVPVVEVEVAGGEGGE